MLQEDCSRFYVDLGAYDPIYHSNTFLLYLLGWRGLNIDANEDSIQTFEIFRPTDINVHAEYQIRKKSKPSTMWVMVLVLLFTWMGQEYSKE